MSSPPSLPLRRSSQFDGFDQGLTFFLPNQTWLQPPGYVHTMINDNWQPNGVQVVGLVGTVYSASAQVSDDRRSLTIQVVNPQPTVGNVTLLVTGFTASGPATVSTLSSTNVDGGNTASQPTLIAPVATSASWSNGAVTLLLPPNSFTVVSAKA